MAGSWARLREQLASSAMRRSVALLALAVAAALLVVDYVRVPARDFQVGEVADRDVRATADFKYVDWASTLEAQRRAEAAVPPVYDFDATLAPRLQARIHNAFEQARRQYAEQLMGARAVGRAELSEQELSGIAQTFLKSLELSLAPEDVDRVIQARWDLRVEEKAAEYVGVTHQRYIIADRSLLPDEQRPVSVVRLLHDGQEETTLTEFAQVRLPEEARQALSLYALDNPVAGDDAAARAAAAIGRAAVRPNFSYNQLITEERRREARDAVGVQEVYVQQGKSLVREGDVLTRQQVDMIKGLQRTHAGPGMLAVLVALVALSALVYGVIYVYGATQVRLFAPRDRDIEAMALVGILVLMLTRAVHEVGDPLADAVGMGLAATSAWYMAPVAGGAMVIRVLCNAEAALLFALGMALAAGVMMDQQVLLAVFYAVSALVGAAAAVQSNERAGILRAGVLTGLVNAGTALLINLVQVHLGSGGDLATGGHPLWDVSFAFAGGLLSGGMVLVLVPLFELFGFLTDYKLIELANLNHPLLRQLMLRAPGTYHHSVIMGSLCESAAEAIGANALQTRVACYFHDIGKALQPQYFIENQRGGPNPHDRLAPVQSARAILSHVVDGQALAEQYKLPRPVVDGVAMHHGTSLIKYFYVKALDQAEPGVVVEEADYRYPGPIPDSKEAGIMLLADRCEAACRTLKEPSAHNIRALVQKLVNDAVTDGQLENCPLTVQELYKIVDSFTETLLGIYHHRIEYPGMPRGAAPRPAVDAGPIITLDLQNPLREAAREEDSSDDPTAGTPLAFPPVVEDPSSELPASFDQPEREK